MHICPQEVMLVLGAVGLLKTSAPLIKHWCESCLNGTHKSCEEHRADTVQEADPIHEIDT